MKRRTWKKLIQKEHENCGTEDCCQKCDNLIEQARAAEEPLFKNYECEDCNCEDCTRDPCTCDTVKSPAVSARWNWYGAEENEV